MAWRCQSDPSWQDCPEPFSIARSAKSITPDSIAPVISGLQPVRQQYAFRGIRELLDPTFTRSDRASFAALHASGFVFDPTTHWPWGVAEALSGRAFFCASGFFVYSPYLRAERRPGGCIDANFPAVSVALEYLNPIALPGRYVRISVFCRETAVRDCTKIKFTIDT
jgi:hypothetical protein